MEFRGLVWCTLCMAYIHLCLCKKGKKLAGLGSCTNSSYSIRTARHARAFLVTTRSLSYRNLTLITNVFESPHSPKQLQLQIVPYPGHTASEPMQCSCCCAITCIVLCWCYSYSATTLSCCTCLSFPGNNLLLRHCCSRLWASSSFFFVIWSGSNATALLVLLVLFLLL